MSSRISRHSDFLNKVAEGNPRAIRQAINSQLTILVELFYNISHLYFTQKEKNFVNRRLETVKSLARIRSAKAARKALATSPLVPILAKAALASR